MTHPPPYEEISCCPVSRQLRARDAGSARSLDAGSDAEDEIIARDPLVREPPPSCRHWRTGRPASLSGQARPHEGESQVRVYSLMERKPGKRRRADTGTEHSGG